MWGVCERAEQQPLLHAVVVRTGGASRALRARCWFHAAEQLLYRPFGCGRQLTAALIANILGTAIHTDRQTHLLHRRRPLEPA